MDNKRVSKEYRKQHLAVFFALSKCKEPVGASALQTGDVTLQKMPVEKVNRSLRYLAMHGWADVTAGSGDKKYSRSARAVEANDDLFKLEKLRRVPRARKRVSANRPWQGGIAVQAGVSVVIAGTRKLLSFKEAAELRDLLIDALKEE